MTIVSEMFDNGCRRDVRPGSSRGPLCAIVAAVCTVGVGTALSQSRIPSIHQ